MLDRLFLDHPRTVGETYLEHLGVAFGFAAALFGAALACLVHALVPGLFRQTGSRIIRDLHGRMGVHRVRNPAPPVVTLSQADTAKPAFEHALDFAI